MDISMCLNNKCPKRLTCYRYTATPCTYQTYGEFTYDPKGGCDYYWETVESKKEKYDKGNVKNNS